MRIQHNIAALNSYRQLNGNNSALGKNLEKLSSGYRINRAGDDAAGLAISEKMRAQITGLETASKNANDGISLVQTAEGALTEVHSMLNRMVELADQSANGTYDDETDRANLQKEVESLKAEINRISEGTNFNGINLLDGSLGGGGGVAAKAVKIENVTTGVTAASAGEFTTAAAPGAGVGTLASMAQGDSYTYSVTYKDNATGTEKTENITLTVSKNAAGEKLLVGSNGREYATTAAGITAGDIQNALGKEMNKTKLGDMFTMTGGPTAAYVFKAKENGSDGAVVVGVSEQTIMNGALTKKTNAVTTDAGADEYKTLEDDDVIAYTGGNAEDAIFTVNGKKFVLANAGTDVTGLDKNVTVLSGAAFTEDHAKVISQQTGLNISEDGGVLTFKPSSGVAGKGGLTLQIGDTAADFNQLTVSVDSMSATSLGIGSIDVSTQDGGKAAVDVIKAAINKVSSTRGDLGAAQNRLEHTINNLGVTTENMTAAESRIRDVDMAEEMMMYTKNNILVQASTAMLAQANTMPQSVLQLLQ